MSSEIEYPEQEREFAPYQGETWEQMTDDSVTVAGADLETGDQLIGVPFAIFAATFRPGDFMGQDGIKHDYVSLEVLTGDEAAFKKARKRNRIPADVETEPGEVLVINEAGTGLRRQIVAIMESWGWIQLPEGTAEGKFRESRLDSDYWEWNYSERFAERTGGLRFGPDGLPAPIRTDVRIHAPRGLRVSEYENDYTKSGRTRYFA
jgi:hypothetical protein